MIRLPSDNNNNFVDFFNKPPPSSDKISKKTTELATSVIQNFTKDSSNLTNILKDQTLNAEEVVQLGQLVGADNTYGNKHLLDLALAIENSQGYKIISAVSDKSPAVLKAYIIKNKSILPLKQIVEIVKNLDQKDRYEIAKSLYTPPLGGMYRRRDLGNAKEINHSLEMENHIEQFNLSDDQKLSLLKEINNFDLSKLPKYHLNLSSRIEYAQYLATKNPTQVLSEFSKFNIEKESVTQDIIISIFENATNENIDDLINSLGKFDLNSNFVLKTLFTLSIKEIISPSHTNILYNALMKGKSSEDVQNLIKENPELVLMARPDLFLKDKTAEVSPQFRSLLSDILKKEDPINSLKSLGLHMLHLKTASKEKTEKFNTILPHILNTDQFSWQMTSFLHNHVENKEIPEKILPNNSLLIDKYINLSPTIEYSLLEKLIEKIDDKDRLKILDTIINKENTRIKNIKNNKYRSSNVGMSDNFKNLFSNLKLFNLTKQQKFEYISKLYGINAIDIIENINDFQLDKNEKKDFFEKLILTDPEIDIFNKLFEGNFFDPIEKLEQTKFIIKNYGGKLDNNFQIFHLKKPEEILEIGKFIASIYDHKSMPNIKSYVEIFYKNITDPNLTKTFLSDSWDNTKPNMTFIKYFSIMLQNVAEESAKENSNDSSTSEPQTIILIPFTLISNPELLIHALKKNKQTVTFSPPFCNMIEKIVSNYDSDTENTTKLYQIPLIGLSMVFLNNLSPEKTKKIEPLIIRLIENKEHLDDTVISSIIVKTLDTFEKIESIKSKIQEPVKILLSSLNFLSTENLKIIEKIFLSDNFKDPFSLNKIVNYLITLDENSNLSPEEKIKILSIVFNKASDLSPADAAKEFLHDFRALNALLRGKGDAFIKNIKNSKDIHQALEIFALDKLNIDKKDWVNPFVHSRDKEAIYIYAANVSSFLETEPDIKVKETLGAIKEFILSVKEHRFNKLRYNLNNEHLQDVLKDKKFRLEWMQGEKISYSDLMLEGPKNLNDFLKQNDIFQQLPPKDFPFLKQWTTENADKESIKSTIKGEIENLTTQLKKTPEKKNEIIKKLKMLDIERTLIKLQEFKEASAIKDKESRNKLAKEMMTAEESVSIDIAKFNENEDPDFSKQINSLNLVINNLKLVYGKDFSLIAQMEKILENIKIQSKGWTVEDTDLPLDILMMGEVPGSCQNIESPHAFQCGLIGIVLDGKYRCIEIKDKNGVILARRLVRLMKNNDEADKQVLFKELLYKEPSISNKDASAIDKMFIRRAKALNRDLVTNPEGELPTTTYTDQEVPTLVSLSGSGVAPSEYVDQDRMQLQNGEYDFSDSKDKLKYVKLT